MYGQEYIKFQELLMVYWGNKLCVRVNYFMDPVGNVLKISFEKHLIDKGYFCGVDQLLDFYKLDIIHYIGTIFLDSIFFQFRIKSMSYVEIKYHVPVQIRPFVDHFT